MVQISHIVESGFGRKCPGKDLEFRYFLATGIFDSLVDDFLNCIRIIGSTVDLITELLSGKASSVDDDFHAINVICPVLEELQIFNTIA